MKYAQLTTRQIALHKELCAAIDENKDISDRLQAEKSKDIKDLLAGYIDLLFYAITSGKTRSAESILTYIDSKSFKKEIYSTLAINLFDACCAKDKENAKKIIAFAKENNILESLLKKHLNNDVAEELFRKNNNGEYVHNNTSMITALGKHARKSDYAPKMGECAKLLMIVLGGVSVVCAIPALCNHLIAPYEPIDYALVNLFIVGAICAALVISIMFVSILYNNWSHKRDCNNDIIKGLQEQLDAEQNSQQQSAAPIKEQEEGKPSPDSTVLEMVSPEAGAIVGNVLLEK